MSRMRQFPDAMKLSFHLLRGKKPLGPSWPKEHLDQAQAQAALAEGKNVGIKTGHVFGFAVIDIDADRDPALDGFVFPNTWTVKTNKGVHLYYSTDRHVPCSVRKISNYIDTKGDGGYVVAVGSIHPDTGVVYEWAPGLSPDDVPMAPMPEWVYAALANGKAKAPPVAPPPPRTPTPSDIQDYRPAAKKALVDVVASIANLPEGQRNDGLNRAGFDLGQLVGLDLLDRGEVEDGLSDAALTAGLEISETKATIASGLENGIQQKESRRERILASMARRAEPLSKEEEGDCSRLPRVFLPGGAHNVRYTECAAKLGRLLSVDENLFLRKDSVVRVVDDDSDGVMLEQVGPAALASQFEKVADLWTTKSCGTGQTLAVQKNCTKQQAEIIAACEDFRKALPPLRILTRSPVLVESEGELAVVRGYHRPTGTYAAGGAISEGSLDDARALLNEMLMDFQFATPSDRSRALAAAITPALVQGGLLGGRAPLDLSEADQSQTGKGYRAKLTAAIYRDTPRIITQREGGTGGLEESFSAALIRGAAFVSIDNVRGKLSSPAIESALTEEYFSARMPYGAPTDVDMRRVVIMLTSNKAELTVDLANRCSPVLLRKQPEDYRFKTFEGGRDILDHVRAHQDRYLGAVFAVVRVWWEAGRPRTTETRHDYRTWAQTLDWIVRNILGAAPLCDGLKETKSRMTTPSLNWLRDLAVEVERAKQAGNWLRTHEIVDILHGAGQAVPGMSADCDLSEDAVRKRVNQATGRRLAACFRLAAVAEHEGCETATVNVGGAVVERREKYDSQEESRVRCYRFTVPAMELPSIAGEPETMRRGDLRIGEEEGLLGSKRTPSGYGPAIAPAMAPAKESPVPAIPAIGSQHSTKSPPMTPKSSDPHKLEKRMGSIAGQPGSVPGGGGSNGTKCEPDLCPPESGQPDMEVEFL